MSVYQTVANMTEYKTVAHTYSNVLSQDVTNYLSISTAIINYQPKGSYQPLGSYILIQDVTCYSTISSAILKYQPITSMSWYQTIAIMGITRKWQSHSLPGGKVWCTTCTWCYKQIRKKSQY